MWRVITPRAVLDAAGGEGGHQECRRTSVPSIFGDSALNSGRKLNALSPKLPATERCPVEQRHALHAARREYQKLGKMIDESAFGGRA
jgi:hypothetical protein